MMILPYEEWRFTTKNRHGISNRYENCQICRVKNTMIMVWVIVGLRSRRRKDQSQQLPRSENALC